MMRHARIFVLFLLLWLPFYASSLMAEERHLVLVAGALSPIKSLSLAEARKLYLGAPSEISEKAIITLRNASDPMLQEVFMQRVMYMAMPAYERQILNRVFRAGGKRPAIYSNDRELAEALNSNPLTISYMWDDIALAASGIRIIGE